jgi:hypothetical protein
MLRDPGGPVLDAVGEVSDSLVEVPDRLETVAGVSR